MSKVRTQFICQQCNYTSQKWLGRCPECQTWDSLVEETVHAPAKVDRGSSVLSGPRRLNDISEEELSRIPLPFQEIHRVLGGGLTRGSVVLLAGDPGIGKSTLLLQLMGALESQCKSLLYVSGEESAKQIRLRAQRLEIKGDRLLVLPETNVQEILQQMEKCAPEVAVMDSIQTLYLPDLTSIPGSVSQVREVADRLVRFAKQKEIALFIVGHVTKEGSIAGPMTLEHLVDTVLFFEGEKGHSYRILRAMKNRFGPTDEVGIFEMRGAGLKEVTNPSELFLRDRPQKVAGTVVFPSMEGSRPLLVEVQGLSTKSFYGVPLRVSVGFDKNRLTMLLAVLEKRAGLRLSDQDIHVNVVGGLKLTEPAADLAVMASVVSSYLGKAFPSHSIVFGEVGLAGEVRKVNHSEARTKEASKLGFENVGSKFTSIDQLIDLFA